MKIALDLKEDKKEEIINKLKQRNYEIDTNSFGCIWVYGIGNIHNPYEKNSLTLEHGKVLSVTIKLEDIKYFEIHND